MTNTKAATEILAAIPPPDDWPSLSTWFNSRKEALAQLRPHPGLEATLQAIDVRPYAQAPQPPFGHYANSEWRKLAAATLLADWACYPVPVDQVSFERLAYVMHIFPAGFRTWWVREPRIGWLPAGYTGWYPISAATFGTLTEHTSTLRDRSVIPLPTLAPQDNFLYLFNYSMVPSLHRTSCSKRLVRGLAEDLQAVSYRGLAAITVSADGIRIAERFGMRRMGTLIVDGSEEWVYAVRRDDSRASAH